MAQVNSVKISKILVAIDGSDISMKAAECAVDLAKLYNADLLALHVLPEEIRYSDLVHPVSTDAPNTVAPITSAKGIIELSILEAEDKWFSRIRKNTIEAGIVNFSSDVVVANKSVVAEITEYAESHDINLIVIGTRGRSGLKKMLLGSVASGVVTYVHCPVIVVK